MVSDLLPDLPHNFNKLHNTLSQPKMSFGMRCIIAAELLGASVTMIVKFKLPTSMISEIGLSRTSLFSADWSCCCASEDWYIILFESDLSMVLVVEILAGTSTMSHFAQATVSRDYHKYFHFGSHTFLMFSYAFLHSQQNSLQSSIS